MAIRNEDWAAIDKAIKEAIDKAIAPPSGWRKLVYLLRELGPIIGTIAVVLALVALVVTLGIFASSRLREEAEFRGRAGEKLTNVENSIKSLTATVEGIRLKQISENPTDPRNISEVTNLLRMAKSAGTKLDKEVVKNAGAKFIAAANKNPEAWSAAAAFVDYKSFLDTSLPSDVKGLPPTSAAYNTTHYDILVLKDHPRPEFGNVVPQVPREKAAVYEIIGADLNKNSPTGDPYVVLQGGATALDDREIKNAIFHKVNVFYFGGRVILENVYFIDCTFTIVLPPNPKAMEASRTFASAFLASGPSLTFSSMGG